MTPARPEWQLSFEQVIGGRRRKQLLLEHERVDAVRIISWHDLCDAVGMTFVERECGQVVDRRFEVHHFALRPPQAAFGGIEQSGADPVATGVRTYVNGDEVARPPARPPSLCGDQKTKNAGLRVRTGWIAGNFGTGFCDQGERSRALDEHLQFETGV